MTPGDPASATTEVVVLGATGSVGAKVSRSIAGRGHAVRVASRELRRASDIAREIPGAEPIETSDLRRPPAGPGFVVNCTGEEDPANAAAWTAQGWGFIDITASSRYCQELARLDPAGATVIAGVGLMPGLSSLIAAELARLDPSASRITLSALLGLADDHGEASTQWTLGQLGRQVSSPGGGFRNFSDPAWIDFPGGFGRRRAWRYDFADRVMLPARTGVEVSTRYCFDSRFSGEAMAAASIIPGASRSLLKLAPIFERSRRGTDWWAAVAETDTGGRIEAIGRSQSQGTADLTADAVDTCLNDPPPPGFHYLTDLTTLANIEARLPEIGILIEHRAGGLGGGRSVRSVTKKRAP